MTFRRPLCSSLGPTFDRVDRTMLIVLPPQNRHPFSSILLLTMATCVCTLQPEGNSGVSGALKLTQSSENGPTSFEGTIRGLTPGQKHGISLCVYGDLSDGSTSCGPTFNPFGKTHGAPTDDPSLRMVGDLGNVEADDSGIAVVKIEDSMVKLFGPHSVIGRSIVVCAGTDDTGRGGQDTSLTTGNAGPRIAYGVIGIASSS